MRSLLISILLGLPLQAQLAPSVPRVPKDINSQGGHSSFPEELGLIGDKLYFTPPDNPDFTLELLHLTVNPWWRDHVIEVSTNNHWPENLSERDTPIFFSATTSSHGRELWKTDGTFAGTSLVKDISPGVGDANPKSITQVGDSVFFVAEDDIAGAELWKSDGTEAGTFRVKDIIPGISGSNPSELRAIGSLVFFVARDLLDDSRLWRSDGTEEGTFPLIDTPIESFNGSENDYVVQTNQLIYFVTSHPESGTQLWFTDGTLDGTRAFSEIHPEVSNFENFRYRQGGSELHFVSNNQLWRSSDTPETAAIVYDSFGLFTEYYVSSQGIFLHRENSPNLIFRSNESDEDTLLYGLHGESFFYNKLTPFGDRVFLIGDINDGEASRTFISDGTVEGTHSIQFGDDPSRLTSNDERAWFISRQRFPYYETSLWLLDETLGVTKLFETRDSIWIRPILEIGDGWLFRFSAFSEEYWYSDGTVEGTSPLLHKRSSRSSYPDEITASDQGQVYFSATTDLYGRELWKSDGTDAGTLLVSDILPGQGDSSPENLTTRGSQLFFTAETEPHGRELWTSDGTEAGTTLVADLTPGVESSDFSSLTLTDSWAYVVTRAGDESKLWRTDGTQAETTCISTFTTNQPRAFTSFADGLVFSTSNSELWFVDDDTGVFTLLGNAAPTSFVEKNGNLYFGCVLSLWTSDGTPEGTRLLRRTWRLEEIYALPSSSSLLLFDSIDYKLRRFDLTQESFDPWASPIPGGSYSEFKKSVTVDNSLFFLIEENQEGTLVNRLWTSNGTLEGTFEVAPIEFRDPNEISSVGSSLYLNRLNQLYKLPAHSPDDTPSLVNNSDGNSISSHSEIIVSGNRAFFSGGHDLYGVELYSFEIGVSVDPPAQISAGSAVITGKIDPSESPASALLEYGSTPDLGSTLPIPLPPPGSADWTEFSIEPSIFLPSTTYYYRVSVSNEFNSFPSPIQSFTTANAPPVFLGWSLNTSLEIPASISISTLLTNTYDHEGHSIDLTLTSPSSSQGGQVTLVDGNFIYTPPLGYTGADDFPITLTDEFGASSDAIVQVYIQAPLGQDAPSGHNLTLAHSPSGSPTIHFTGLPGRIYQVQRSTDLKTWTSIATLIADGNGVIQHEDLDPAHTTLFYRITR